MERRVCLVTGGTSGVGFAIARSLVQRGERVVITSRSAASGRDAARNLSGASGATVDPMVLDLAHRQSIERFVTQFLDRFDALHLLSLNAAAPPFSAFPTSFGCGPATAVNYIGHFHLANLLTDILRESAPARVITVVGNAIAVRGQRLDADELCRNERIGPLRETLRAAALKTVFALELARRLDGSGVTSNAFHPGLVKSGLVRGFPFPLNVLGSLAAGVLPSDCPTGEFLASSPEVEGQTGGFYERSRRVDFQFRHIEPPDRVRLWERTEAIVAEAERTEDRA